MVGESEKREWVGSQWMKEFRRKKRILETSEKNFDVFG